MADIVRLTRSNAGLLDNLADDVFDGPVNALWLGDFLADARHVMFVAVEAGLVVGMGSGVEYFHPDKPPQFWINEVGVAPPFRQRGIGRALSQALIAEGRARGCAEAWLAMEPDNAPARALYESVPGGEPAAEAVIFGWTLED